MRKNIFTFICDIDAYKHSLRKKINFYIFFAILMHMSSFRLVMNFSIIIIFLKCTSCQIYNIFVKKKTFICDIGAYKHSLRKKIIFLHFFAILMHMSTFRRVMNFSIIIIFKIAQAAKSIKFFEIKNIFAL